MRTFKNMIWAGATWALTRQAHLSLRAVILGERRTFAPMTNSGLSYCKQSANKGAQLVTTVIGYFMMRALDSSAVRPKWLLFIAGRLNYSLCWSVHLHFIYFACFVISYKLEYKIFSPNVLTLRVFNSIPLFSPLLGNIIFFCTLLLSPVSALSRCGNSIC